jgi:hypothetical protein
MRSLVFSAIGAISCCSATVGQEQESAADRAKRREANRLRSRSTRRIPLEELADIRTFRDRPSDRFLVDLSVVRGGRPYLGKSAQRPHTGCHLYFQPPNERAQPSDPTSYPPIYAVADGFVSRIDEHFRLRPIVTGGRRASNVRYGVTLAIARDKGRQVDFHYSIEPMIDPQDKNFYLPFIRVKIGQQVKRGDVIAYMYLPRTRENRDSHIHFNLMRSGQFQAPAIFANDLVKEFHSRWGERGGKDGGQLIPPCIGYRLTPPENPFGDGAKTTL